MPNLSIKNVPEELAERLRQRAEKNHRSLQGELLSILALAMSTAEAPDPWTVQEVSASRIGPGAQRGARTPEQVAEQVRRRWPQPIDSGPLAVDILRQDRDAR